MCHHKLEVDDYNRFFNTPRTNTAIITLVVLLNLLAYKGLDFMNDMTKDYYVSGDGREDPFTNYRFPLFLAFITLIGFGVT